MELLFAELAHGWPDAAQAMRILLRTHMLVALGSALFVMAALESGAGPGDMSRVVQGVASGIGFLGAGAILKLSDKREVRGLTTAAGIWITAATGLSVGLGRYGLALMSALLSWMILAVLPSAQPEDERPKRRSGPAAE